MKQKIPLSKFSIWLDTTPRGFNMAKVLVDKFGDDEAYSILQDSIIVLDNVLDDYDSFEDAFLEFQNRFGQNSRNNTPEAFANKYGVSVEALKLAKSAVDKQGDTDAKMWFKEAMKAVKNVWFNHGSLDRALRAYMKEEI
jgi:hypothetical protein